MYQICFQFQFILVTLVAMEIGARQSEGFKLSGTEYQTVVEPENSKHLINLKLLQC